MEINKLVDLFLDNQKQKKIGRFIPSQQRHILHVIDSIYIYFQKTLLVSVFSTINFELVFASCASFNSRPFTL